METNNWRPAPGGGEPTMDTGDWRTQLQPDSRQRIVNKIMDTLKRHLPFSGQEGLQELKKIAVRFEEKIYTAATSQSDYLRKISLKMLTMENKSQNTISNSASNSKNPPDTVSHGMQPQIAGNQGQSLSNPMVANQSQSRQPLLSQNIQNNITATGVPGSANLTSALPSVGGLPQTSIPNVGQNSNLQNIQNISGVSQNSVANSMGQGVSSNIFANTQRQMPGRPQQVVPQQQQQQSQNPQHYLYPQHFQQQLLNKKYPPGSIPPHLQSHIQQQQTQQQQNLLQSSQQSVMQPSSMQPAPLSGLQQNQQSSVQQSTQPMLQQNPQSVLRQQQQPQQTPIIHQQQTPMQQQPILPTQQQQQQHLAGQPNSTNMQQNQLIGNQNSIPDMQQQQRLLGPQNNLSNLQQQQLMSQQNNLSNIHHQQQLGPHGNVAGLQQQQQQLLGTQSGMLQQSKVPMQQQTQQSSATLLPTQGQQSQPQPPQQQLMSQIQAQPGQFQQQLGLQQQQRLQTSGPLLQSQNMLDQQKQLFQSQRAISEASSTSLDFTAQTGNASSGDWQEEVYQKIKTMKDEYLPELNEMYQKIAGKLLQHDSLPQQPKNEQLEKLKIFKTMLERIMAFLQVSKSNILPGFKEKLGSYEKQIINFLNSNRPRKLSGQLPLAHMPSMQQSQRSQSQITQVQPLENQMNPQLQSMNLQGSVSTMQKNNVTNLQHNSFSSLSGVPNVSQSMINTLQPSSNIDSGQGNALSTLQQVAVGPLQQMMQQQHNSLSSLTDDAAAAAAAATTTNATGSSDELKMRVGVKAEVFQQHQVGQRSAYHHQQLKSGPSYPISSPQFLQAASPQMPQHPSPQINQQNLLTSLTKTGTPLLSANSPFIVPSPSTPLAPSPIPDIRVKEPSLESLCRGRKHYEPPRYMTIKTAIEQLLEVKQKHTEPAYNEDTTCVGFARLGSEDQMVVAGSMKQLLTVDFGAPLHCLVIVGETHPVEEEMLGFYALGGN